MATYDYQLLLKHLLEHGVSWAPGQEIVYSERFRYRYEDMYQRVLKLAAGLKQLGVRHGAKIGVIEWDSHRYLEMYFGISDEKWGERPLAIIASKEGSQEELTAETLQSHLASFVSEGQITKWAVPKHFIFVDQLPKTSVGKIDKKELRRQYSFADQE